MELPHVPLCPADHRRVAVVAMTPDPHDSVALRGHVDAALDPGYERAFGILDVLVSHRCRHGSGVDERNDRRLRMLTEELDAQLTRLDDRRRRR